MAISTYTAKYTRIASGYAAQVVEWPEVITEGATLKECRVQLEGALRDMIAAYKESDTEIPVGPGMLEPIRIETEDQLAPSD